MKAFDFDGERTPPPGAWSEDRIGSGCRLPAPDRRQAKDESRPLGLSSNWSPERPLDYCTFYIALRAGASGFLFKDCLPADCYCS
jgi:hypothetical protein